MRAGLLFSRFCLRSALNRSASSASFRRFPRPTSSPRIFSRGYTRRQPTRRTLLLSATLSPAVFVQLSEKDNGDGHTGEERMLEASRAEIKKSVPESWHGLRRLLGNISLGFDVYILEPILTGLRFLHLVLIFVPVIATVPMVWIGSRVKTRDNERTGTLWWYGFLVSSMERAGPAFIKVRDSIEDWILLVVLTFYKARTMGGISVRHLSNRDVLGHVFSPLQCPSTFSSADGENHLQSFRWTPFR